MKGGFLFISATPFTARKLCWASTKSFGYTKKRPYVWVLMGTSNRYLGWIKTGLERFTLSEQLKFSSFLCWKLSPRCSSAEEGTFTYGFFLWWQGRGEILTCVSRILQSVLALFKCQSGGEQHILLWENPEGLLARLYTLCAKKWKQYPFMYF